MIFMCVRCFLFFFFFFQAEDGIRDVAVTGVQTCALPIFLVGLGHFRVVVEAQEAADRRQLARRVAQDRKSTRLNSSHGYISYAVFCLKKKTIPTARPWTPRRPAIARPSTRH